MVQKGKYHNTSSGVMLAKTVIKFWDVFKSSEQLFTGKRLKDTRTLSLAWHTNNQWYIKEIWVWSIGGMITTGENWSTQKKHCSSGSLCITNRTWIDLKTVPNLRGERPVTERLTFARSGYSWADKNTSLFCTVELGSPFYRTGSNQHVVLQCLMLVLTRILPY